MSFHTYNEPLNTTIRCTTGERSEQTNRKNLSTKVLQGQKAGRMALVFATQIDIATLHPPGPPMRSYAPPGAHEAKARAESEGNGPVVWGLCA